MRPHPAYRSARGLSDWARQVLESRVYAVLATIDRDGSPHSVPVGYTFDGRRFLIPSGSGTRKVRNIEVDPRVRVLVEAPSGSLGHDGWVAADGRGRVVEGAEAAALNRVADGRYLTQAGEAAYDRALAPLLDVTIVVEPEHWSSWVDSHMFELLYEQGYTREDVEGWFLPNDS